MNKEKKFKPPWSRASYVVAFFSIGIICLGLWMVCLENESPPDGISQLDLQNQQIQLQEVQPTSLPQSQSSIPAEGRVRQSSDNIVSGSEATVNADGGTSEKPALGTDASVSGHTSNDVAPVAGVAPAVNSELVAKLESTTGSPAGNRMPSRPGQFKTGVITPHAPMQKGERPDGVLNVIPAAPTQKSKSTPQGAGGPETGKLIGTTPGIPGGTGIGSGSLRVESPKEIKKELPKELPGCFTVAFEHRKVVGHESIESCHIHRNILKLKHKDINPSSICVKIDKTPVPHAFLKGHADTLVVGAPAGPDSEITVRYCQAKLTCPTDCKIPKDEFLESIGGLSPGLHKKEFKLSKWDEAAGVAKGRKIKNTDESETERENERIESDLKRELAELEAVPIKRSENFDGWMSSGATPLETCGPKRAKKGEWTKE